ncbi:Tol-Pal system protein TolB [Chitinimonas arctica]|uniref:Tol-Pal system protein TolB n=1 Tax=Chitinimonas arctica TaxID=2594795 RepID=A0A516SFM1_9NEIS|nr:Tol-Pal system beta propeller repeat protein TolB [Chitinimonas arctica]QDQ26961.1 Tol-Pal system protein TolB [Chitinimonas arctica]
MINQKLTRWIAPFLLASLTLASHADVTIEVTGTGARQLPVTIAGFTGEAALKESVTAVIRADLAGSGRFKLIESGAAPLPEQVAQAELSGWKGRGADALATGSARVEADGSTVLHLRLYDTVTQKQLAGFELRAKAGETRRAAHQLADQIYEALSGERGVFSTRIAYVLKQGKRYELQVADADGHNAQTVMGSNEPIMSPAWSADGRQLAYVSFERKKAIVFVQDLYTGSRRAVAAFKGSNSAPAFSPDGGSLAVTLTLDGISQLYLVDTHGGAPRRLSKSSAIDTEPTFSPDGRSIAFTSDRGGSPQIYLLPSSGGEAQRLTFDGSYNVSPQFSPDGKSLTYVRRDNGRFVVAVMDLASRQSQSLTNGSYDESPSFAPNGKLILYAGEAGNRGVLATVSSDGQTQQRLTANGDAREPAWGPYAGQIAMSRLSSNP